MAEEKINDIVEEALDAPLVVHKKSDASYQDGVTNVDMNETHITNDKPTLERHRFKKDPNQKSNKPILIVVIIIVLAVAFGVLYLTGNISFDNKKETTVKQTTTETTTSIQEAYAGTIVVKGMYIFVDGVEVNGIEGMQDALRYTDKSTTAYQIIDEDANSDLLNNGVLPTLMEIGFYDENTEIIHKGYTGLMAAEETTITTTESTTISTTVQESQN
ncbi:hypothetical protein [uncultured Eubacterium sp.]|uniref:hypothetical protein n=1 Tax=uncultured Eubacterium sp. TaxID=165185 RepID=UPI0015B7DB95|nr:hypothetical protein [uncultured Eubacterium sp.]